jgi:hypothetical protein
MAGLLASEELEKPKDLFWSQDGGGATLWQKVEKELDDGEFGGDRSQEDSEDSDINAREDPNLETEVLGEVAEEKRPKRKNVYVDPKRKRSKAELEEEQEREKRKVKRQKKASPAKAASKPAAAPSRSLRQSTVKISNVRRAQRAQEREEEAEAEKRKVPVVVEKLTQLQLLEEARVTEIYNTAALEQMKKLEAIKKKPVPIRKKIVGPKITEVYKRDGNFVVFEADLPSILTGNTKVNILK